MGTLAMFLYFLVHVLMRCVTVLADAFALRLPRGHPGAGTSRQQRRRQEQRDHRAGDEKDLYSACHP